MKPMKLKRIQDLSQKDTVQEEEARKWEEEILEKFDSVSFDLTDKDIQDAVEEHGKKGGAGSSGIGHDQLDFIDRIR